MSQINSTRDGLAGAAPRCMIAFAAAPGTYRFTGVRITYTTGGAKFWQAEGLSEYIRYSPPRAAADHQS